jgi:hypothetical protein
MDGSDAVLGSRKVLGVVVRRGARFGQGGLPPAPERLAETRCNLVGTGSLEGSEIGESTVTSVTPL